MSNSPSSWPDFPPESPAEFPALLGLSSLAELPINWAGAALLVLGLSLFVLEAKFTSHGILGIGGAVAMVLGAMLLIDGPPEMRIHLSTALSVTVPFALITMFLVTLVIRARRNKAVMRSDTLVNQIAEARTALAFGDRVPAGRILERGIGGARRKGRARARGIGGWAKAARFAPGQMKALDTHKTEVLPETVRTASGFRAGSGAKCPATR